VCVCERESKCACVRGLEDRVPVCVRVCERASVRVCVGSMIMFLCVFKEACVANRIRIE